MRTKIIVCLILFGIITTANAQRHYGRFGNAGGIPYNQEFRPYHNGPHSNFFFRPFVPRVIVRPCLPTVIIERNSYRRYQEPVYDDNRDIMTDEDLCRINRNIQTMRIDNDKVSFLKDQIDYFFLTSSQLSNLLYAITFEDNRLDLAKYAYRKIIDPQNYGLVFNTLTFNSTKHDLDIFIDNQNICRK